MENAKIDSKQLFSLMFLFQLGSAIVTNIAVQAKQDAWISILLGMVGALILFFFVYAQIYKRYPSLPLTGILEKVLSKYIGLPLSIVYICYFFLVASISIRHLGDTMTTYILSETPVSVVIFISLLLVSYCCFLGIEVLGRTAEILVGVMVMFGLIGNLAIIASGIIKIKNVQPILEFGWFPVIKEAVPLVIYFPFGEVLLFLMFFPYLNRSELANRTGLISILLSGLGLSWTFLLIVSVIGGNGTSIVDIPLLSAVEKINVGNFIQRMDSIVVGTFAVGFFIKIFLYVYAVLIGLTDILKLKRYQTLIVPVVLLIFIFSLVFTANKVTFMALMKKLPYLVGFPLLVVIPVILLVLILARDFFNKIQRSKKV